MASMTFSKKVIRATVTLDKSGMNNQKVFEGFATHVSISKTGGVDFAQCAIEIYGLTLDVMAQLTVLSFRPLGRRWNLLAIEAGESGGTLSSIFQGEVTSAYADLNGSSPVLKMEAKTGAYPILDPTPQYAVSGQQSAGEVLQMLASQTGKTFKNEGVDATLSDCVITGDPITKMRAVADAVGADLIIDDDQIALVPRGKVRQVEGGIPVVSADTGMIGYPTFSGTGIQVSSYFRPDLRIGAAVRVSSIVPSASGVWKIVSLSHELSANTPNSGAWLTSFEGMWLDD